MRAWWWLAGAAIAGVAASAWFAAGLPTPAALGVENTTDHVARGHLQLTILDGARSWAVAEWEFTLAPHGRTGFPFELERHETYGLSASAWYAERDAGIQPTSLGEGTASTLARWDECRFGVLHVTLALREGAGASTTRCD